VLPKVALRSWQARRSLPRPCLGRAPVVVGHRPTRPVRLAAQRGKRGV